MSTRILAAFVGLAVVLPLLFFGGHAGTGFVVAIALVLCLGEYAQMAFPKDFRYAFYWLCLAAVPLATAILFAPPGRVSVVIAALSMLTMAQVTLTLPDGDPAVAIERLGRYAVGVLWIGGLLPFLMWLRMLEDGEWWVFLAMCIAWMSDTGAYFAGKRFGRTKLYPAVSPNKTWEGVVGGVASATLTCVILSFIALRSLSSVDCVVLGVLGSLVGVVGDLSESLVKRAYNVKDSGWVIPGHGGMLDRIDALMFVAPTVYGYLVLAKGL